MPRTTTTVTITGRSGPRTVPAAWVGQRLAVNRPVLTGGLSTAPRTWVVTHLGNGYSMGTINAPQRAVIALAKAWDHPDAGLEALTVGNPRHWRWARRWADDCSRAGRGLPVIGPRELTPLEALESAGTAAECEAAVRAAMGAPAPEPDDYQGQWPAPVTRKKTGAGAVRVGPHHGLLEYWWLPRGGNYSEADALALAGWYEVPQADDLEDQCLGSVALTPCEDAVEPDHPDAWPRLLGLV
jgi:hypothetical protein